MSIQKVLENMWQDYLLLNPNKPVADTLHAEAESIVNDHIALRTFNVGVVALEEVQNLFTRVTKKRTSIFLRLKSFVLNTMNTRRTPARRKSLSVSYWSMNSRVTFKPL